MKNRLDFTEYSKSLGNGLFADKINLALLKYCRNRTIGTEEREALQQASDFLKEVITGGQLTTDVFHSYSEVLASQAFTQAVHAVTIPVSSKADFVEYVTTLQRTIDRIIRSEDVGEPEIQAVLNFFIKYSRMNFQHSSSMLECI